VLDQWSTKAQSTGQNVTTPGQPKQLLSVGRLVPRKGIAWFVENVLPNLTMPVHYHVVGSGPEATVLQQLIAELKLTNRVTLHGQVADDALRQFYFHADALIMPNITVSGNPEGFGIVAIEAAASGVPVLAARLEGVADAVIDGDSGFLLESGNVSAWLEALERLLSTAPLAPEHIRAAVAQHFSWQAVGQQYLDLFNMLIASSHGQR
jgi:glycosyltransferase involved in cell wall biosynthesis